MRTRSLKLPDLLAWRGRAEMAGREAVFDNATTGNLGVDSIRCVANCDRFGHTGRAKTHMASAFSRLCGIAAHSDRAIFIGLQAVPRIQ